MTKFVLKGMVMTTTVTNCASSFLVGAADRSEGQETGEAPGTVVVEAGEAEATPPGDHSTG